MGYLSVGIGSTNKRAFEVIVKVCVGDSDTRSTMRNILVRNSSVVGTHSPQLERH